MNSFKYIILGAAALAMGSLTSSCVGDLDVDPTDPNTKIELTTPEEWNGYFGSLYGSLIYGGGLSTSDAGAGVFTRCHWNLQELGTDEAILSNNWADPAYYALKTNTVLDNNEWVYAAYSREFYTARQATEFIQAADKAKALLGNEEVEAMKAEARVLRAYAYYNMIDLFGRGPWVNDSPVGATPPTYDRKQLFDGTVADLTAVIAEGNLRDGKVQAYGRLSKQAAQMLLAKLYLNAKVYTGEAMYDKCADVLKQVTGYFTEGLAPDYRYLFCASNDKYVGSGELIWAAPQKPGTMDTWGGTTYLTAAAYFTSMGPEELKKLGCSADPWNGLRMRGELSKAFEPGDKRALYYAGDYKVDVENLNNIDATSDGYVCVKYTYTTEDDYYNSKGVLNYNQMNDADYPIFRLADAYLMLAECELNGVSGCNGVDYFNKVRARAGLSPVALTAESLLHERQVELYWEGHRRSDLVRFGKYTGDSYLWSWKGGVYEGSSIPASRAVYAIPFQYVSTIGQNAGY